MRWIESVKTLEDPDLHRLDPSQPRVPLHWKARESGQRVESPAAALRNRWEDYPPKGRCGFYPQTPSPPPFG